MTSTAKLDLYEHANALNCTLAGVRSSGKHWRGEIRDALHPARRAGSFGPGDFEACKRSIEVYAHDGVGWARMHPELTAGAPGEAVKAAQILDVADPFAPDGNPAATQVLEIPGGFTQEDIDAAVNDAIQELLANMGALQPATTGPSESEFAKKNHDLLKKLDDVEEQRDAAEQRWRDTQEALRESNRLLTAEIEKRDAVILTLREDFTRLLAESEARSEMRLREFTALKNRIVHDVQNSTLTAQERWANGAPLADSTEKGIVETRRKGWNTHADKHLKSVGLATDGKAIVPAPGTEKE